MGAVGTKDWLYVYWTSYSKAQKEVGVAVVDHCMLQQARFPAVISRPLVTYGNKKKDKMQHFSACTL